MKTVHVTMTGRKGIVILTVFAYGVRIHRLRVQITPAGLVFKSPVSLRMLTELERFLSVYGKTVVMNSIALAKCNESIIILGHEYDSPAMYYRAIETANKNESFMQSLICTNGWSASLQWIHELNGISLDYMKSMMTAVILNDYRLETL
ncbi:MAG: hypothetical protein PHV97_00640 [Candidatus Omnitrophica bacterium]|nr:hypothetical protein [Candidatus Omnitrophota bacterium]